MAYPGVWDHERIVDRARPLVRQCLKPLFASDQLHRPQYWEIWKRKEVVGKYASYSLR